MSRSSIIRNRFQSVSDTTPAYEIVKEKSIRHLTYSIVSLLLQSPETI